MSRLPIKCNYIERGCYKENLMLVVVVEEVAIYGYLFDYEMLMRTHVIWHSIYLDATVQSIPSARAYIKTTTNILHRWH